MCMQAVMLLRGNDAAEARAVLNSCIAQNPRATDAWLALAELEESQGRPDIARSVYRKATGFSVGSAAASAGAGAGVEGVGKAMPTAPQVIELALIMRILT